MAMGVDLDVALDLVHRLPDADGGGEMDDGVGALERLMREAAVADVAVDERHAVRRRRLLVAMYLGLEDVEHGDLVTSLEQRTTR